MTLNVLFKPLLLAAIVLNIVSVAWLTQPDDTEARPPPRSCAER